MIRRWISACVMTLAIGALPACKKAAATTTEDARKSAAPSPSSAVAAEAKPAGKGGGGRFVYQNTPSKKAAYAAYAPMFKHARFPGVLGIINDAIDFPREVQVGPRECGTVNAFYSKREHAVILCYELVDMLYKEYRKLRLPHEKALDHTFNAMTFVLLHEVGHGIIGELDLGVTGGEEDAADDFAGVFLSVAKQGNIAADGALAMLMLDKPSSKPKYFDEHSFGGQRYGNILCTIYGSDPAKEARLVPKFLPPERAARCSDEFRKKKKGWDAMLAPYEKKRG